MSRDEDDCVGGCEFRRWRHQRELELDDQVYGVDPPKLAPVIEPCAVPEPLTTPAKLGSHYAGRARAAGCEDAYDNAMEAKYGKGW
jgi:hypothetical protein